MTKQPKTAEVRPDGLPADFENWETEKLGEFPPYWNPDEGKQFYAVPVGVDFRDPDFKRVIFQAMAPTECQRGPAEDAEDVTVQPGEQFTCSLYAILENQIGFLINLPIVLMADKKVKSNTNKTQSYWTFNLKISPESKKILTARRQKAAGLLPGKTHQAELTS